MKFLAITLFICTIFAHVNVCITQTVLEAHFSSNSVQGKVTFTQVNSTVVKVNINFNDTFHSFTNDVGKINQYAVPYEKRCTGTGQELHDIGTLADQHLAANMEFHTQNITLEGAYSILGMSFVIKKTDGTLVACAPILPASNVLELYAVAAISNSKIAGKFEFLQHGNGDTLIIGQISHSDGTNTTSPTSLKWVVSSAQGAGDSMVPTCPTSLDAYNPDSAAGSPCTEAQEATCKPGDLSQKHGNLTIGIKGGNKVRYVDTQLKLNDLNGKYLVISQNDDKTKVLGCGIIRISGPLEANSVFQANKNEGVNGDVSFKQTSPYHATKLSVNLQGLAKRTGGYHVHLFPIADPNNPSCSAPSVGGHLNPFSIVQANSPPVGQGTMDKYEIGDLSGKFGLMTNMNDYQTVHMDANLPMFGYNSIVGRSIVIHNSTANSPRLTCADIVPRNGKVLSAKLNFTGSSKLHGIVEMRQYQQSDNILTPTIIIVSNKHKATPDLVTKNHNFHVHVSPIGNETDICQSAKGHYNPTDINVSIKGSYAEQCTPDYPYRCELGDTSKKVGTYNVGGGKKLYVDSDTPMIGAHTVLGRSIVFHELNKGAPRLACADIVPEESNMVKMFTFEGKKEPADPDREKTLKEIVTNGLGLSGKSWKIAYMKLSEGSVSTCYKASFYLIDSNPASYQTKFNEFVGREERSYHPCPGKPTVTTAKPVSSSVSLYTSLSLLLVSCFLTLFL